MATNLILAEGASDHVSDQIALIVPLTVDEAYHLQVADAFVVRINNLLYTSSLYATKLPALKADGQGETYLYGREDGSRLPGLTLTIRPGLRSGEGQLPTLGLSAEASNDNLCQVSGRLPPLSLSARAGIRGGLKVKLPVPELTVAVTGDLVGRLDRELPGLEVSAAGSTDTLGRLSRRLPPLSLTVSMSGTASGTLSKNLPTLKLSAEASLVGYGSLARDLPGIVAAGITDITGHQSSVEVSLTLPTLVMGVLAVGGSGQPAPGPARARDESRFTDYVLRYSR